MTTTQNSGFVARYNDNWRPRRIIQNKRTNPTINWAVTISFWKISPQAFRFVSHQFYFFWKACGGGRVFVIARASGNAVSAARPWDRRWSAVFNGNLVPRACDPREGMRGSGIIRCRKPGILAKIELRIHFNAQSDSSLKRIILEPRVPSRRSQARGTRLSSTGGLQWQCDNYNGLQLHIYSKWRKYDSPAYIQD
jgi:hypothetical protein